MLKAVRRQSKRGEMSWLRREGGAWEGGGGVEHPISHDGSDAHMSRGGGMQTVRGRLRVTES
jgi:hypothetical protein